MIQVPNYYLVLRQPVYNLSLTPQGSLLQSPAYSLTHSLTQASINLIDFPGEFNKAY